MTIKGKCYIDLGPGDQQGITYVALSRVSKFCNLMLTDIDEKRFKSYASYNGLVISE